MQAWMSGKVSGLSVTKTNCVVESNLLVDQGQVIR